MWMLAGISRISMPKPNILAFIVSKISAFIWTNRHTDNIRTKIRTDMRTGRSTSLVILIKKIYKRFLLPETCCYNIPF